MVGAEGGKSRAHSTTTAPRPLHMNMSAQECERPNVAKAGVENNRLLACSVDLQRGAETAHSACTYRAGKWKRQIPQS